MRVVRPALMGFPSLAFPAAGVIWQQSSHTRRAGSILRGSHDAPKGRAVLVNATISSLARRVACSACNHCSAGWLPNLSYIQKYNKSIFDLEYNTFSIGLTAKSFAID
jgi:hypothetical protein